VWWHNFNYLLHKLFTMPNWLRALIAGYGAKKLGGGCFSTVLIFIVLWYVLGTCNRGGGTYNNGGYNNSRTMITPVKPTHSTTAVQNTSAVSYHGVSKAL
jgi:hypothetical protein